MVERKVYASSYYTQSYQIQASNGPCFICDCSGENFGSLTDEQLQKYAEQFKYPEHFFRVGGEIKAVPYPPEKNQER